MELVTAAELAKVIGLPATDPAVISAAAASNEVITPYLTVGLDIDHSTHMKDREAALAVAVDIFQARTAAGGQAVGLDFQPLPFRMGAQLMSTVSGLLGTCIDQGGELG